LSFPHLKRSFLQAFWDDFSHQSAWTKVRLSAEHLLARQTTVSERNLNRWLLIPSF
jgi:hypothetical protein